MLAAAYKQGWSKEVRPNEVIAEGMQALTPCACWTAVFQYDNVL